MPARLLVIGGPARSGKTTRLLDQYRSAVDAGPLGSTLWISPHHRAASLAGEQLLATGLAGCFRPNILTFDRLSEQILATSTRPLRPLPRGMVRLVLSQVIEKCLAERRLPYFRPIARTPGFLDLLSGFIRELKRLEIWPEELAKAQGRKASPRDRELCFLYQKYQDLLNQRHLFDDQGHFWIAREELRSGHWGPFRQVRKVFVDGFSDFTRTELDVLQLLAGQVEEISISLVLDRTTDRPELFARAEQTLVALRERLPELKLEHLERRELQPPAIAHIERHLFRDPRSVVAADDARGVEILAAAGVTHEVELVAERIKSLLTSGDASGHVKAADILVVFRSLGETGTLVREVFARYGIPVAVASPPALGSAPLLAAVLGWLRLEVDDWPFRGLVTSVGGTYFRPDWPEYHDGRAATALVRLARELALPSGRAAFHTSLEWLEAKAGERLSAKQRLSTKLSAAQLAGPLARRIAAAFDRLPRQATPAEWWRSLKTFATDLGMLRAAGDGPLGDTQAADSAGWTRIQTFFAEVERLARWKQETAPRWNLKEVLAHLEDVCSSESLGSMSDERGAVRVMSAETVRGLSAPYVFVCGLSEKAFPPPHREDCLYTDADARRWGASGLPLPSNADRGRFEMLLFYEVVTRATRHLVLSYPGLDAQAQALVPSPFLREVEHVCGAERILRNQRPHLDCIPANDDVLSIRDFRIRAVSEALAGREQLFQHLCTHPLTGGVAQTIVAGLTMTESRDAQTFGPFEGMFSSDASRLKLADRFGPGKSWSPSRLEDYANCPHEFFLKTVLRVRPLDEPELAMDYMGRGQMLHWLLAQAHRELNQHEGVPTTPSGAALVAFTRAVDRFAGELRREGTAGTLAAGMVEINVRQVLAWLERYQAHHQVYDQLSAGWNEPLQPAHFEVSFGPQREEDGDETRSDARDSLSSDEPFELECGGELVRFNGRIDRIDVGRIGGQAVFSVVDYKSGKPRGRTKLAAVKAGNSLQLPLYALAAEKLLADAGAVPFRAAYWHMSGEGYQDEEAVKFHLAEDGRLELSDEWSEMAIALKARVASLVRGVRSGQFPMHSTDKDCTGRCDYKTVCRVNQARSREKAWQPPHEETS